MVELSSRGPKTCGATAYTIEYLILKRIGGRYFYRLQLTVAAAWYHPADCLDCVVLTLRIVHGDEGGQVMVKVLNAVVIKYARD